MRLRHEFVDYVPKQLDYGVLYVSLRAGTAVHQCACGCGEEVVTPLGPAEWRLTWDGRTVSLAPSVGNWSFPCRSHYWIDDGTVRWAHSFSETEITQVRREARARRAGYYDGERSDLVEGLPRSDVRRGLGRAICATIRALRQAWTRLRD